MKEKLSIIFLSLVEIIVGLMLLINPVGLTAGIITTLGIILVIIGVISIVQYFRMSAVEAAIKKSLSIGILAILLGGWLVLKSGWFIALFPLLTTLYGIIVLVNGVMKVQWSADSLRLKIGHWGWMALSAAVTIICAFVILAHPFSSTAALWLFIGITLIVEAMIDIVAAVFKKQDKDH